MNTITRPNGRFTDVILTGTHAEVRRQLVDAHTHGRLVYTTPPQTVGNRVRVRYRLRPSAVTATRTTTAAVRPAGVVATSTARPASRVPSAAAVIRRRRRRLLLITVPTALIGVVAVGGYAAGFHGLGVNTVRAVVVLVALVLVFALFGAMGGGHHCPGCPDH